MTNKKMTKRDWFKEMVAIVENSSYERKDELKAVLEKEIESLNNKSRSRGLTATQKENIKTMETIKAVLAETDKPKTVTELMQNEKLAGLSSQKMTALLKKLTDAGEIVNTKDKRKSLYALNKVDGQE